MKFKENKEITQEVLEVIDTHVGEYIDILHERHKKVTLSDLISTYNSEIENHLSPIEILQVDHGMIQEHMLEVYSKENPEDYAVVVGAILQDIVQNPPEEQTEEDQETVENQEEEEQPVEALPIDEDNVKGVILEAGEYLIDPLKTEEVRKSADSICRLKNPVNLSALIDIWCECLDGLDDMDLQMLDFSLILHDIVNYAEQTYEGQLDFNIFYLHDDETIRREGYNYFCEFVRDVSRAYDDQNAWFYAYRCEDCGTQVYMKRGEAIYYMDKNLRAPKRCRDCRQKRQKNIKVNTEKK